MKKALIIEDDADIRKLLELHLKDMQFSIETAADGKQGLSMALSNPFDFIILDIMLPGMDGIDICKEIRYKNIKTPIMMLTSRSEEIDKVVALESGADDYMTKPFGTRELQARVKAILRRSPAISDGQDANKIFDIEGLHIDLGKRVVKKNNVTLSLTPKEFELIALFIQNPGKTYSRIDLLDLVWKYSYEGYEHTVNSHINRLRSKIEDDMNNPQFILTSWGIGYRFKELK
ncbi:MAG: response regulator [Cryomorphaceae bacterium]|nr:response regulator [Cryomorphaceae bacterium]